MGILEIKSMVFLIIAIGGYDFICDFLKLVPSFLTVPDSDDFLIGL
jgi:hypothetical protein